MWQDYLSGIAIRCDLIRKKMIQFGAVSPATAKSPEELGVRKWIINLYLAKIRGIRQTEMANTTSNARMGKAASLDVTVSLQALQ